MCRVYLVGVIQSAGVGIFVFEQISRNLKKLTRPGDKVANKVNHFFNEISIILQKMIFL